MKTLLLPKAFIKVIRWLLKAVIPNHSRPPLQCISYRDGVFTAVDGFRMHCYRTEDADIKAQFGIKMLIRSGFFGKLRSKSVWLFEEEGSEYPANCENIFPKPENEIASVVVNARYLAQALTDFPVSDGSFNAVILRLFKGKGTDGKRDGVMTLENEECTAAALIMPMCPGGLVGEAHPADFSAFSPKPETAEESK